MAVSGFPVASEARLAGDARQTRFVLDLDKTIPFHAFTLADPYRVVVDIPQVNFQLPAGTGAAGRGLIKAFRYGLVVPGGSRIVFDLAGPAKIANSYVLDAANGQPPRLVLEFVEADRTAFVQALARESRPELRPAIADAASRATTEALPNAEGKPETGPESRPDHKPAPADSRPLIVIDPGHGGSDRGAIRNGTAEADLALDMAKRLQQILVARGWQVRMTRETDVDVYQPNDSAHDELQARVDVANNAGARLFVSIHVNSFINSGPRGTTTYYSKPSDVALAKSVQRVLSSSLGTKDDGIVKSHLYVTLHTFMPAVLVETAFLSNPDDFTRLTDDAWRQRVAQGIAEGIDGYTQSNPVTGSGQ